VKIYSIDQSFRGFGHVVLEDGKPIFTEVINVENEGIKGFARSVRLYDAVMAVLKEHSPDVVTIEDYAYGTSSNNITDIAEFVGLIKFELLHRLGYSDSREAMAAGQKSLCIQTQSEMKKFSLGNGGLKKDTSYLLTVMQKTGHTFENDNIADAFMHAWRCGMQIAAIQGRVEVSNLPKYQQESLMSAGVKRTKGVSMAKALKLPEAEKRKLVGF
jgi:Holliday junction resolvasome RuvABC endonuclease subunit